MRVADERLTRRGFFAEGGGGGSVSQLLDLAIVAHCVDVDPQDVADSSRDPEDARSAPRYRGRTGAWPRGYSLLVRDVRLIGYGRALAAYAGSRAGGAGPQMLSACVPVASPLTRGSRWRRRPSDVSSRR